MFGPHWIKVILAATDRTQVINNISHPMKRLLSIVSAFALALIFVANSTAADPAKEAAAAEINKICPITGKPVDPQITLVYEGKTYAFADEASRGKWETDRKNSLYHKLGGKAAIDAAVESFYVKVLADDRIKHFFEDINMNRQRKKQKEFLSAALGGPIPWTGKDLRKAHANIPGLNETHFNAVAEHLEKTLVELKVQRELIDQVLAIVGSVKDQVLNRKASDK
jgi:hemoglobin